jgi:acyl-CoA-binding protein
MTTKDGASVSNDEKLKVYALYKQVTVGECAEHGGSQPWAVQVANRAKWDAWKAVEGKPYSSAVPPLQRRRCNAAAAAAAAAARSGSTLPACPQGLPRRTP